MVERDQLFLRLFQIGFEPRVFEDLLWGQPVVLVCQQARNQVFGFFRNQFPVGLAEVNFAIEDGLKYFILGFAVERREASEHEVKDAAG